MKKLSHINEENKPQMVDVGAKNKSNRIAHAQSIVIFPKDLADRFKDGDIKTKKGPVFFYCNYCWSHGGKKNTRIDSILSSYRYG